MITRYRTLLLVGLTALFTCTFAFCARVPIHVPPMPGVLVVNAQTLPATKTATWTANPAADQVTKYTVRLDGSVVGSPTGTSQAVTFATGGAHTH